MESYKGRFEPTRFEDLTVTVDFHCHSACRFCIVQEGMNYFRGVPFEKFKETVDSNTSVPRYRRVTFTGGEVTMEKSLFSYLTYARDSGSFEHIRLQTNGRLLADEAFTRSLIEAGVDEFFVSLHGFDAATQDDISQRAGSFDEALAGIANIRRLGACLMTNTVLTTMNVATLADIVETVRPFAPARMEFWNYLPMEDYADERQLLAPMSELAPALRRALARAKSFDIPTAVKYVPQCLLGEFRDCVDNTQPDVVIVEKFYDIYPKFACIHEARCEHSETCLGLHHPYITKFGWEEQRLVPLARTTPWREPEHGAWAPSDRPRGADELEQLTHPEWRALVAGVAERHGARLSEVLLQRRLCVFRFALGEASVDLVLSARDSGPALARSRSFDMHYRNVVGTAITALGDLVNDAVRSVIERDAGALSLMLDERKGLVGPAAFRRRPASRNQEE
jgi:cyclic pyranopterin phosphate synthase